MVSIEDIIEQVAECYGITTDELLHGDRRVKYSEPRQVVMYLCNRMLGMGHEAIGNRIGKTRITVLYAVRKVAGWVAEPKYNRRAAECVQAIMWNNSNEKE